MTWSLLPCPRPDQLKHVFSFNQNNFIYDMKVSVVYCDNLVSNTHVCQGYRSRREKYISKVNYRLWYFDIQTETVYSWFYTHVAKVPGFIYLETTAAFSGPCWLTILGRHVSNHTLRTSSQTQTQAAHPTDNETNTGGLTQRSTPP